MYRGGGKEGARPREREYFKKSARARAVLANSRYVIVDAQSTSFARKESEIS